MRESKIDACFKNPDSRFRGAPFWAWNTKLEKERLIRQIGYFKEMGMGGFHMHSRTGLDTPYMEEEFLAMVKLCVEEAKRNGMYACLYDEDRWPSGSAGGKVTKNEAYRNRYLVLTPFEGTQRRGSGQAYSFSAYANVNGNGRLAAAYRLRWQGGLLQEYERLNIEKELPQDCWYVYLETAEANPWYNDQAYVDTLNPDAVHAFLRETHEKYYELLKEDFGKSVPSIFTDEPQFSHKTLPGWAEEKTDIILPYTECFGERYLRTYGESLFDRLPEIIWEMPEGKGQVSRYRYHELLAEQFACAYADVIGEWCGSHGLQMTGHLMEEGTLEGQTGALGEAMRPYRSFQLPGIDMLCDARELTTAKQAQSVARQYGREGILSELYGVTGWDFDFRRHKLQGDWQAALGVTRRVHHLAWMNMAGEAKRDYPASIFYQSPWYREYRLLEDHYARLNTVMTQGEPVVKIAVIHPIESYWLHFGPAEQTSIIRGEMEEHFQNLTKWLLFSHLDFDFVAESLLGEQFQECREPYFCVGEMRYETVILPACETLRSTTVKALRDFMSRGGRVIVLRNLPVRMDGVPFPHMERILTGCECYPFERSEVIRALADLTMVQIRNREGEEAARWLYQLRKLDGDFWLFVANGTAQGNPDIPWEEELEISLWGSYEVSLYRTLDGTVERLDVSKRDGRTAVRVQAWEHDSFLFRFAAHADCNARSSEGQAGEMPAGGQTGSGVDMEQNIEQNIEQPAGYVLSEPNVMLLDAAQWRLDGGNWHAREDILRADDKIRDILGYARRTDAVAQPWTVGKEIPEHLVELKFCVRAGMPVQNAMLAAELQDDWEIYANGQQVDRDVQGGASSADDVRSKGWFVDECTRTISLPGLMAGENELILRIPFGTKTNLEWCYLLGDFGVKLAGDESCLVPAPDRVYFGDYTEQGFPFYAGNMEYCCKAVTKAGYYRLQISKFRSPLIRVYTDGRDCGPVMLAPYVADLGYLKEGEHTIRILSYGNRANAFGTVHCCDERQGWCGPNAWRTTGGAYSREYQLKPMGILKAPVLLYQVPHKE